MNPLLPAVAFLLLVLAQDSPAEPRLLDYPCQPGEQGHHRIELRATLPDGGTLKAVSRIVTRVTSASADEFEVEAQQQVTAAGLRDGNSQARFTVSRKGRLTSMKSPQLDHPVHGACVRDLAFLFMTLPAGPVEPGATWATLRTVYLPELDIPVNLPPLELAISCKLAAFEGPPGRPIARIDLTAKPAPGMPEGGNVTGVYRLDLQRGRVLSGSLRGTVPVRILVMELDIPFEIEVFEDQIPAAPPGAGAR